MKKYFTLFLIASTIIAYSQPKAPILQIETGVHTSKGYEVATDASGKYLLSASIDKTARLWDAHTGNLLKTLHIPIGGSYEGALYACALSPDGKIAAVAGNTGLDWDNSFCIYLINTQTGVFIYRIKNLPEVITELEFSPDGNWLAAGFERDKGISIFETKGWGETKLKEVYKDAVKNIAFKKSGDMAAVSAGGNIRLYNNRFKLIKEKVIPPGLALFSMALSPADDLMAIGYQNSSTVEVLDAHTLAPLYKPSVPARESGGLYSLSFSAVGSKLYGGGNLNEENGTKHYMRCWEDGGKGAYNNLSVTTTDPSDIISLPGGSMAIICFDPPEMTVINADNKAIWNQGADKIDFIGEDKSHFRINNNGTSIGFTPLADKPYSFDIPQRKLQQEQSLYPAPVAAAAGTVVKDWLSWQPKINGKDITQFGGQGMQGFGCTDINSNGNAIVFGESWNVLMLDKNANLKWQAPTECHAYDLNISGNDKVVAAGMSDGTIRWLSMANGKTLLTFYLHPDKKRWVLFTPTGYYDASPGAEDLLGWQLNNGPDEAPSFFPVSRFKEKYYRPDIIDALFETYNEDAAITLANSQSKKQVVAATERDIRQKLPPTIIIHSPANGSNINNNTVSINYEIKSPGDAPAKNLRVLVDGRPVATERGVKVIAATTQTINVSVPQQDCTITLLAENDNGTSPETSLFLKWVNAAAPVEDFVFKPKLYVLAIGVSDYNNPDFKLGLASKDAGDFAATVAKQKGILFSDVIVKKLIDKEATKDAMTDGLDWIQKQTGQKDVAMIFYAGHGINDQNGVFYMLPVAADMERIRSTCLNFEELKQTVSSIAGKVVVFIDACHSGNVMGSGRRGTTDINAMVNELSNTENGAITFTSSTGKEFSLEDPSWGNGAFTKAVIEGLNGMAAFGSKNKITIKSLDIYISERVKELTKGKQHPTSVAPPNVPDFPIAIKQ